MELALLGAAMALVLAGVMATRPEPRRVPVRVRGNRRQR